MLRFVMRRSFQDNISGAAWETLETIDIECPEIEQALTRCGHGESGHDCTSLVGVEILNIEARNDK